MQKTNHLLRLLTGVAALVLTTALLQAAPAEFVKGLPTHAKLKATLKSIVGTTNGGFELNMSAAIVNRDGVVQAIAFSGTNRHDQWPGSRVIAAQKANTANAFSLNKLPLSTANLYSAVQPGGSLFGLQESNPVDTLAAYGGNALLYGQPTDPMVGRKIGGINVFGGGLALYGTNGIVVGALGVSGDSSVADHIIAWKIRHSLNLDNVPGGVSPTHDDNIVFDITEDANGHPKSASGWGHPVTTPEAKAIGEALPITHPVGRNP